MADEMMLMLNDDGVAHIYDETYDIVIHCESAEEQKEVEKRLMEMRWIPCSERLPEVGQDVLFSVRDLYVSEGCLREDGDWSQFRWQAIQRKEIVTAWKPLPEPWEGEQDEDQGKDL